MFFGYKFICIKIAGKIIEDNFFETFTTNWEKRYVLVYIF